MINTNILQCSRDCTAAKMFYQRKRFFMKVQIDSRKHCLATLAALIGDSCDFLLQLCVPTECQLQNSRTARLPARRDMTAKAKLCYMLSHFTDRRRSLKNRAQAHLFFTLGRGRLFKRYSEWWCFRLMELNSCVRSRAKSQLTNTRDVERRIPMRQ